MPCMIRVPYSPFMSVEHEVRTYGWYMVGLGSIGACMQGRFLLDQRTRANMDCSTDIKSGIEHLEPVA